MPRNELIGLSYRRQHVLAADGDQWEIQGETQLRRKAAAAGPGTTIQFTLELSSLDPAWQAAIARARTITSATIDGVPAQLTLHTVELHFATYEEQTEPHGRAAFQATVDAAIPFPRNLDDVELATALARAGKLAGDLRIQADEIEMTERYWIFPIREIGASGVIVHRATGHPFLTSGSLERATWIWAYEHRLLDDPAGDLVVEYVADHGRAFDALRRFARIHREDLETLPLVIEGCATWLAAAPLLEAGSALTWNVAPRVRAPSG